MKRPMPFDDERQQHLSSDIDDCIPDSDEKVSITEYPNDQSAPVLSSEAWLFQRAKSYQEYMELIPIPTNCNNIIPCNTWTGLGKSIKQIYGQPLHYLTNIHLKNMDHGRGDEFVPLDMIIHPVKAEISIWIVEEVNRLSASPHQLLKLWTRDTMYHTHVDDVFPKLG